MLQLVLKPVAILTKMLQTEQYIAGDLKEHVAHCKYQLKRIIRHNHSPQATVAALDMIKAIDHRCKLIFSSIQFLAALYLDPRFINKGNGKILSHEEQVDAMVCIFSIIIESI